MEVATKLKKIQDNPFRTVKLIRVPQKSTPSLTKDEYPLLINAVQEQWLKDIIDFDILTGLRLGELVNLRWSDVDMDKGMMTIESTPNYQVKHGKMRVLPLHPEAKAILSRKERTGEWVFVKDDGTRPRPEFISKKFKSYVRAAGLSEGLHFHSLRATFASWCANSGVSMYTLQNLMGHSSMALTESYATPDQGSARVELAKITLENR
jgi:integrase